MSNRKVIQITATETKVGEVSISTLVVLCDDGTVLQYAPREDPPWKQFPQVPDEGVELKQVSGPVSKMDF